MKQTLLLFFSIILLLNSANAQYNQNNKSAFVPNILTQKYDLNFCKIDLIASDTTTYISGNVMYNATVVTNSLLDTFLLQLSNDYTIDSVLIDTNNLPFTHVNDEIKIPIAQSLGILGNFDATIYYHGKPINDSTNRGITNSIDGVFNQAVTFTLSEPYFALDWFPCKQDLTDKIDSAYIYITVDSALKAGSNGVLKNITDMGNGMARYEWVTLHPIDFYLLSLSVSNYDEYNIYAKPNGYADSILIQNYIYPNCLTDYKTRIDETVDCINYYSDILGLYPYADEKYGHCMAPIGGGMEHQTMTTLGFFDLFLVAHEIAHQWFGNMVTCKTWQDIWVNEGIASYCEYLAVDYLSTGGDNWMKDNQHYAMNDSTGSIYIPFDEIFDYHRVFRYNTTYKKGASIVHQLRFEINNDSLFYLALRNFLNQYKNSVATGLDFKTSIENTTGKDFTEYFDQWYFGEGYPYYQINWSQNNDSITIYSTQTTTSNITPFYKSSLEFKFFYAGGDTTVRVVQTANSNRFKIKIPHTIDSLHFDPNNWLLKGIEYIRHSIENVAIESIKVGPNPFRKEINIKFNDNYLHKSISIINFDGKIMIKSDTREKSVIINTENLPKGMYLIKIDGKNSLIRKMVKL